MRAHPGVALFAEPGELLAEPVAAEADAEREPAAAEAVERRGLAGELGGAAAGDRADHRPEAHLRGGGGDRGQGDPGVGRRGHRFAPAEVVPAEDAVPARFFGLSGETGDEPRVGRGVEEREPERVPGSHARHATQAGAVTTSGGDSRTGKRKSRCLRRPGDTRGAEKRGSRRS